MKLHALISTYNAVENIIDCLKSLEDKVDDVYILDGRWMGVEGYSLHSTDGTIQKIFSFSQSSKLPIFLSLAQNLMNQVDSRNVLISFIPDDDWFLIIDSDEKIVKWENVKETLQNTEVIGFRIRLCGSDITFNGLPMPSPRLMRKNKNVRYTRNHRYMENDDGEIRSGDMLPVIKVTVAHEGENKAMRPVIEKYKSWLLKWEQINAKYLEDYKNWIAEKDKPTEKDKREMKE